MIGSQIMPDQISAAAMARLARGFAGMARNRWLHQAAEKIYLAINRRIPVGFEDNTGFHLGVQIRENDRPDGERQGVFAGAEHF